MSNLFKSAPDNCLLCGLGESRTNIVYPDIFSNSKDQTNILIIGEAPGAKEDASGKPFVGSSGKILRKELEKLPGTIIITNTVKCRPPKNRNPNSVEVQTCKQFLDKEIVHYNPDLIILVGRVSSSLFFDSKTLKNFSSMSGTLFDGKLVPVIHPASTMYNATKNRPIWDDSWLKIQELLIAKFPHLKIIKPVERKEQHSSLQQWLK